MHTYKVAIKYAGLPKRGVQLTCSRRPLYNRVFPGEIPIIIVSIVHFVIIEMIMIIVIMITNDNCLVNKYKLGGMLPLIDLNNCRRRLQEIDKFWKTPGNTINQSPMGRNQPRKIRLKAKPTSIT